ncbi:MAG: class I SAM-dependent methyltransferase [Clostridia bacterium]
MENDKQKSIFLNGEADNYFKRNVEKTEVGNLPEIYIVYSKYIKPGSRILEIGCGFGNNLYYFHENHKCECFGIDPSKEAIEFGKEEYSSLNLSVGTADELDFEDSYFDFIFFGFCLYLVDRKLLPKVVYETDRVLKDSGILGITDFDAKFPYSNTYKHNTDIHSFKMDYGNLFLAFPHYIQLEKYSNYFNDANMNFDKLISANVLLKSYNMNFPGTNCSNL